MKRIILTTFLLFSFLTYMNAQEPQKSRKERRAEKQEKRMEEVEKLLKSKEFVFNATHALPMGGGSIYLNYSYDVEVKGDTVNSYLPFYGVAYRLDYGGRDAGFDFTEPAEEYNMEDEENGYRVEFEIDKGMDNLNYTFHISELGYATLNVISTNRQAISYYGRIEAPEEE
ncbi:MAG TPA: DUF4251 domain-containing protein [Tangfeifania sp.]|nr:DUF4251 domain-containing protein [Tangfeifania sp.]